MVYTANTDHFYMSDDFQAFFKTSHQSLLMKANSPYFTVLAVSDNYLTKTHKQRSDLLNQSLFTVFPGSEIDPTEKISVLSSFQKVIEKKEQNILPVFKYEIFVPGSGRMETQYWNNINEPVFDPEGNVAYLINTTANITEQVLNNIALDEAKDQKTALDHEQLLNQELAAANEGLKQTQEDLLLLNAQVVQSEETLRMATDAAELGTYYIDIKSRVFISSPRLREMFGFYPDEPMPFETALNQIHPDYRETVADMVEAGITKGDRFDLEYPVTGYHDGKIRWVKGLGIRLYDRRSEESYFTGVLIEITEQKLDEQRKNDFIGMVSHELKTPLTSLNGYLQLLQGKMIKADENITDALLGKASNQVKKMTTLINGFLHVSGLDSGKIHINKHPFLLDELVTDMIADAALIQSSQKVIFSSCEPILLNADRDKIGNVVSNMLSNAFKYSGKEKRVEVKCEITGNLAQISFKDEGIGIKPENMEKLFERYYRVESNLNISGFGIGLYLCSEIIHRHGGQIWAESEEGKGSTFFFNLPIQ